MKTFLYNIETESREGVIREGRYLVDGKPGILPDFLVELEMVTLPDPTHDSATQTIEYREYADIANKKWIKESYIRNLSPAEIQQRIPASSVPNRVTLRQFKLALIQSNISLESAENCLNNIQDNTQREIAKVEWNHGSEINRDNILVSVISSDLNLTTEQTDNLFILAANL